MRVSRIYLLWWVSGVQRNQDVEEVKVICREAINRMLIAPIALSLFFVGCGATNTKEEAQMPSPALETAHQMVAAWNDLDADRIADLFAEDAVLHSMMIDPIEGRENLRSHISKLLQGATDLELKLKNVAVTGDTVILERVDEFTIGDKRGAVPVVGVLVIENGLVKEWREYYDRNQLLTEMGVPSADDTHGGGKSNAAIYQEIINAWRKGDVDTVMTYFSDDIEFHSLIGRDPHRGKKEVREFLNQLGGSMTENRMRIVRAEESGADLLVEGIEDFIDSQGRHIQIPYMGAYRIEDGKVTRWRDYFDPAIAERARNGEPLSEAMRELIGDSE